MTTHIIKPKKKLKQRILSTLSEILFVIICVGIVVSFIVAVILANWTVQVSINHTLPIEISEVWMKGFNNFTINVYNETSQKYDYQEKITSIHNRNYNYTPYFEKIPSFNDYASGQKIRITSLRTMFSDQHPIWYEYDYVVPIYNKTVNIVSSWLHNYEDNRTYHIITDFLAWREVREEMNP